MDLSDNSELGHLKLLACLITGLYLLIKPGLKKIGMSELELFPCKILLKFWVIDRASLEIYNREEILRADSLFCPTGGVKIIVLKIFSKN